MATANSKAAKGAGPADKGIQVISRPPTFRRAGRVFTSEPTVIPLSELSEEEGQALVNEPNLVCTPVDIPSADDTKK
ncbi:MAG: hypothetical protein ACOY95_06690 [Pseudomonadota bacterium]